MGGRLLPVAGRLVLEKLHLKLPDFFLQTLYGFPAPFQFRFSGMPPGKTEQEKNKRAQKKRNPYYSGVVGCPSLLIEEKIQLDSEHMLGYFEVLDEENGYETAYDQEEKSFYVFHQLFERRLRYTSATRLAGVCCRISVFRENTSHIAHCGVGSEQGDI
jgi:hypothetical protein